MITKMDWTPEMTQMLRSLRAKRGVNALSFIDIAERMSIRFGVPFTKNACIGKAFRLRLRKSRRVKSGRKKRAEQIQARAEALANPVPIGPAQEIEAAPIGAPITPPQRRRVKGQPIDIYQLRYNDCRWPLGPPLARPPFMYCGGRVEPGEVYCPDHHARAHTNPQPRKATT
jgi:hypothetical protein